MGQTKVTLSPAYVFPYVLPPVGMLICQYLACTLLLAIGGKSMFDIWGTNWLF